MAQQWRGPQQGPPERGEHGRRSLHPAFRAILKARDSLVYSGERTIEFSREGKTVRLRERVYRYGRKTRAEFLDGPFAGQTIVDDGRRRILFVPSKKEARVLSPRGDDELFWGFPRGDSRGKREPPDISVTTGPTTAGRPTDRVTVSSDGRVLLRLDVDKTQKLVLRREAFDPRGAKIAGFEFDEVVFRKTLPDKLFAPDMSKYRLITLDEAARSLARKMGIRPRFLQDSTGYSLVDVRPMKDERRAVLSLQYARGAERVSLYSVKGEVDLARLKRAGRGRLEHYVWESGEITYVLLGSMPSESLADLARRTKG